MEENIVIRKANCDDLSDIKQCIQQSFEKYIARIDKKPAPMLKNYDEYIKNDTAFVLEYEKRLVGLIVLITKEDYVLLDTVAVAPAFQGKSLGKHLLQFAETFTRQNGKNEIRLLTNEKMYENIEIYNHYGYIEYARGKENGYHRVYFKKELGSIC